LIGPVKEISAADVNPTTFGQRLRLFGQRTAHRVDSAVYCLQLSELEKDCFAIIRNIGRPTEKDYYDYYFQDGQGQLITIG